MTAQTGLLRLGVELKIARAQLLRQIARDDTQLVDLLQFAHAIGDATTADTVTAFRAAQDDALQSAQAELLRLPDRVHAALTIPVDGWPVHQ